MKRSDRTEAVQLRRDGVTYQAIMNRLGLPKSTLWQWLKAEGLVETHPQKLAELKQAAQRKGAATVKAQRIARTQAIIEQASREVGPLSHRDLWLLGVALYWAEGAKQKPNHVSAGVIFANSDPVAINVFVKWVKECCGMLETDLTFEIYLHETADAVRARAYWAQQLALPIDRLSRVRWKHHHPATRRTNVGDSYHGLMRVRVARSSALNRRITGWVMGIGNSLGSGVMVTQLTLDQPTPGSTPGSPVHDGELARG